MVGFHLHKTEAEIRALPFDEFVRWIVFIREHLKNGSYGQFG